jgi:predicted metalloprotease
MRWRQEKRSTHIEDRRTGRIPGGTAAVGVGGLGLVVILLVAAALGIDPTPLLQGTTGGGQVVEQAGTARPDVLGDRMSAVLADTEDTWGRIFAENGLEYKPPTLVLFNGSVDSACGYASAAVGPFYCPGDQKVYLDLDFLQELQTRFGAPGDFAQAYVLSHEIGHHVQTLLGTMQQVDKLRARQSKSEQNATSVEVELQADCFAGVWANRAQETNLILDAGDLEEGLGAAAAVGDDRIQQETQGYVVPDSFTHGSSADRVKWFKKGFTTGDPDKCDTFNQ